PVPGGGTRRGRPRRCRPALRCRSPTGKVRRRGRRVLLRAKGTGTPLDLPCARRRGPRYPPPSIASGAGPLLSRETCGSFAGTAGALLETGFAPSAQYLREFAAAGYAQGPLRRWLVWGAVMCVPAVAEAASGRVYDSKAGRFVQGARVTVFYDATDASQPGQMVPAGLLGPGQQGQETTAEGVYRLDLPPGRRYRIVLDPPAGYAFPSQIIPPTPGFAPQGPVVPESTPSLAPAARRIYYLRFVLSDVTNNHIPLDPLTALVVQQVRADRPAAGSGDVVAFDLSVENRSSVDLLGVVMRFRPDPVLVVRGSTGGG